MTTPITLYTNPMSRGRTVRWMLEEIGQPYDAKILAYGPDMKTEAFLKLNPMGKIPVLTHGETVITETAAICAYLADAFPAAGLAPALNDPLRADYYRWMFYAAGPLEAATVNQALGVVVPQERRGMAGYGSMQDVCRTLRGVLDSREYVVGDRFTTADLMLCAVLRMGLKYDLIEKDPCFVRYAEKLAQRPACVKATTIDDTLLATAA